MPRNAASGAGPRRVTIRDVAKAARVSPSTASRAIAGSSRISAPTRMRVLRAMEELGYHPNAIARSLVSRASRTLVLVFYRPVEQAFAHPFFGEALKGIAEAAREHRYSLLVTTGATHEAEAAECLEMLRQGRADGAVLLGSRQPDPLIDELSRLRMPFVVLGRVAEDPTLYWVNNDNLQAAAMAAAHLVRLGHRRIALIGGQPEMVVTQDRVRGFLAALEEAGLKADPSWIRLGEFSSEQGYREAAQLLALPQPPTAIVAMDDMLAAGVLRAAREAGVDVPGQLSVVGFNDDPVAELLNPPLTTVRIPAQEMGDLAARQLIGRLEGNIPPMRHMILPTELVIRGSTAPPSTRALAERVSRRS